MALEVRDAVVDWIVLWSGKSGIAQSRLLGWLGVRRGRFHQWQARRGQGNRHNAMVPRATWLLEWEMTAILEFHELHPGEGYRRLAYMMLDEDVVAVSPSSVRRVLARAGVLPSRFVKRSLKGTGFEQPLQPHQHWHVDISFINIHGTFYYLFSILDGASRSLLAWDLRQAMTTSDVEITLQRAREQFPHARPRIISDNGPQFIADDFKRFIRLCSMTHVRTSPYYPQSNGKIERWHRSMKTECIRPGTPLTLDDARRLLTGYIQHYNHVRLHSALGYITPLARLQGMQDQIFAQRQMKLVAASQRRQDAKTSGKLNGVQPEDRATVGTDPSAALDAEYRREGDQLPLNAISPPPPYQDVLRDRPESEKPNLTPLHSEVRY